MPTKFQIAKDLIKSYFDSSSQGIFKQSDISEAFAENRLTWGLPKSMTGASLAKNLVDAKLMRLHAFPFPNRSERRYAKSNIPMLEVLQSIKENSYYTHESAMQVHGILTEQTNDIYINFEQPDHMRNALPEQTRIDAAFKGNPRKTNNVIHGEKESITMLNGMYTGLLGVENKYVKKLGSEPASIQVTNLERTLIDITVRPYYARSPEKVLKAFKLAQGRVDLSKLAKYLEQLEYVYPYHQAIGWYLEKAGYPSSQLKKFKAIPRLRRFYLTHKMKETVFNEFWQIFVPAEIA